MEDQHDNSNSGDTAPPVSSVERSGRIHQRITRGLQILMLVAVGIAVYEHNWMTAFLTVCILALSLLPSMLSRRFAVRVPAEFEVVAVVFIFAAMYLGEIHGYYERFWWWDVILHMGSGFLLGIVGFLLVYVLNQHEKLELHMKPGFVALFSFTFALTMGTVWEIFEFGMDAAFELDMQKSGLVDTMWDLIVDGLGGIVIAVLGYFYLKSGSEYFVQKWIARFIEENPQLFRRK